MAGDRLEELIELIAFHDVEAAGEPGAWHGSAEHDRIRRRAYSHALQAASVPGADPQWATPSVLTASVAAVLG